MRDLLRFFSKVPQRYGEIVLRRHFCKKTY